MKKLTEHNSAIPFTATDIKDNVIHLADFKGQKVLLTFFRKAACPFCNMNIQQLIRNYPEFEKKGIKIIALFASTKEEVQKYAGKQNPPFAIIPDQDFKIYGKYGVDVSYKGMLKSMLNPKKVFKAMFGGYFSLRTMVEEPVIPADFLIDENQNIFRAYYGKDYDDHLPVTDVLAWKGNL